MQWKNTGICGILGEKAGDGNHSFPYIYFTKKCAYILQKAISIGTGNELGE